jgi:hypothetical protein
MRLNNMRDEIYVGALISERWLEHSAGPWKKHKYISKINGIYKYPKEKISKFKARQKAPELIEKYDQLAKQYDSEAGKLSYEATLARQQQLADDADIKEARKNPAVKVTGKAGTKEYSFYLGPRSNYDNVRKEKWYRNHRAYQDGDTQLRDTIIDSPAAAYGHKKRSAESKAKTANAYKKKRDEQKRILNDRDKVDKAMDLVANALKRAKRKKKNA